MDGTGNEADLKILEAVSSTPKPSVRSVAKLLGMRVPDARKRIAFLSINGLIARSGTKKDALKLTGRGRFLLEVRDPKMITGYSAKERVPDYLAFKFALGEGFITGDVAHSYAEFLDVIKRADSRSLVFHLYRGDFDNWFTEVFRDKEMSSKLSKLKARLRPVDQLRTRLIRILGHRLEELGQKPERG